MIKTIDGTQTKRLPAIGDRQPLLGGRKPRAVYTASGGETSINLSLLTPAISYVPQNNQISVKRSTGGNPMSGVDFFELTSSSIGFPDSDPLYAGEIVEITLDFLATGVMAVTPRPDVYTGVGTAGQTLITANFSWPYNMNSGSGIGAVKLIIEGIIQTRGSLNDYTEVNLSTANTNQILLTSTLLGGEKIIILPVYQMIDQSAAASSFYGQAYLNMQNAFGAGTQAFIEQVNKISVPSTTIVGRAQIPDIANDLRASFGIDRIQTQQISLLQDEFGANGEPVYGVLNDDRGLIRCVGNWSCGSSAIGQPIYTSTAGDYIEVAIYGTGLNVLYFSDVTARDLRVNIDGSDVGSNIYVQSSAALTNRNYTTNHIATAASSLTLGMHTIKIKVNTSVTTYIYGFEILNQNASGYVNINPGSAYKSGAKYYNPYYDSVAYNSVVTGATGGRLVHYLNTDGSFGQAFTSCGTSPAYLASSSHTYEDVARTYYIKEFGAGRSAGDDFSLSNAGVKAFTLDDGVTSLVGTTNTIIYSPNSTDMLMCNAISTYWIITFVGTGFDFLRQDSAAGSLDQHTVYVDGTSRGTLTGSALITNRIQKICSGLPYGSHTVKMTRDAAAANGIGVIKFIVYQPKKPVVPANAIEIAEYNVAASLTQNAVAGLETISTGVIRKQSSREFTYVNGTGGTSDWVFDNGEGLATIVGGWRSYTNRQNAYIEYTFYGTGFEYRGRCRSDTSASISVLINGSAATTTNFPTITAWTYGTGIQYSGLSGSSISPTTNIFDCNDATSQTGIGMGIKGLPLGRYTVRFTNNNASSYVFFEALDIITPIHVHKINGPAVIQNSLSVGSQGLLDLRSTSPSANDPSTKAWAMAVGVYGSASTSLGGVSVPVPDMSCTLKTNGGPLDISYSIEVTNSNAGGILSLQLIVDGVPDPAYVQYTFPAASYRASFSQSIRTNVSPGFHKIDLNWTVGGAGGSMSGWGPNRNLIVR